MGMDELHVADPISRREASERGSREAGDYDDSLLAMGTARSVLDSRSGLESQSQ